MEDSRLDDEGERPLTLTEFLDQSCIEHMKIGMTYDEYWNGDNSLPKIYRELWEHEQEVKDRDYWHLGQYVNIAMINAISRVGESERDIVPYPEEPYFMQQKKRREEESKKQEALAAQVWMNDLVRLYANVPNNSAENIKEAENGT